MIKILGRFKDENISKFDLFFIIILFIFFIFSYFLYERTLDDTDANYIGFSISIVTTFFSIIFSMIFIFIKKIFLFWLKKTKSLVLFFLIPIILAPTDNLSYHIFPLERQNMILLFMIVYSIFCIFVLLKFFIKESFFLRIKISQKSLMKIFFLLFLFLFTYLLVGKLTQNNIFFELIFSLIFIILVILFFWFILVFFTSEKEANKWGSFVLRVVIFIFLLSLIYGCSVGDWLCPSGSFVFLFFSFLISIPYAFYFIIRNFLLKLKHKEISNN